MEHTGSLGGQLLPLVRGKRTTYAADRECAECSTILSVYNPSNRCSLHKSARSADRALLRCPDDLMGD